VALSSEERTATTVHQEFRVLRRILNVAVRNKLCPANPFAIVEFPVILGGLFRLHYKHYMTWFEEQKIEKHAPARPRTCGT